MKNDPKKIIVALDYAELEPARKLVAQLSPELCRLKVGNILFTRYGPKWVEELMQKGFDVFLDLKFHDIPQTVAGACRSAAQLGVWMVNLHISGGIETMRAARKMLEPLQHKPWLIGVTLLTSLLQEDLFLLGMQVDIATQVRRMALLAQQHGLDGVVCSAQEAQHLREQLGDKFILVTPGIRLPGDDQGDQKRTMTPQEALAAGSSYLVIGRPITAASNPLASLQKIIELCR